MIDNAERLLLKIFHDYYVRNLSQNDIAARYRISRKKVQRYLEKGRAENLVEVKIRFPARMHGELESALEDKFGLVEAMVADADDDPGNRAIMVRNASEMAADYFWRIIASDTTVSVTWSAHVTGMMDSVLRKLNSVREKPKNIRFVITLGAVIGSFPDLETLEAARHLSTALKGDLQVLMAPNMAASRSVQKALQDEPQILALLDMARHADVAFFGIGSIDGDSRQVPMLRALMPEVEQSLRAHGAVGDINGHFFDADGNHVPSDLDGRLVGLNVEDIRALPLSVGIATGNSKYNAVRALLRGGVLKVLATDAETATRLLSEKEE